MQLTKAIAEQCLKEAGIKNPGPWTDHSRYVAQACQIIASHCDNLNEDDAYCYGLLHDIGRYVGVTKERHMLDGYTYCKKRGWDKAAQIALDHVFMLHDIKTSISDFDMTDEEYKFMDETVKNAVYDDYDLLVQLCDSLALPTGFCILEKRFVDVALRYGTPEYTVERWKKTIEIKDYFSTKCGISIYKLLPGIIENSIK